MSNETAQPVKVWDGLDLVVDDSIPDGYIGFDGPDGLELIRLDFSFLEDSALSLEPGPTNGTIRIETDILHDILMDTMLRTHSSIEDETYRNLLDAMTTNIPLTLRQLEKALTMVPPDLQQGPNGLKWIRKAMDQLNVTDGPLFGGKDY